MVDDTVRELSKAGARRTDKANDGDGPAEGVDESDEDYDGFDDDDDDDEDWDGLLDEFKDENGDYTVDVDGEADDAAAAADEEVSRQCRGCLLAIQAYLRIVQQ